VLSFIDDIILADKTVINHASNLQLVLERSRKYGVKISSKKSTFLSNQLKILGQKVTNPGVFPDPEKLKAVLNIPAL